MALHETEDDGSAAGGQMPSFAPESWAPIFGVLIGIVSVAIVAMAVCYVLVRCSTFKAQGVFHDTAPPYPDDSGDSGPREPPIGTLVEINYTAFSKRDIAQIALGERNHLPVINSRLSAVLDWQGLQAYRLDSAKLQLDRRLATGGFGSVFLGSYAGDRVAVKLLLSGRTRTPHAMQRFIDEVTLLASLKHPNIVEFIGASWHTLDEVHLVVEYMNMGDLKDYLDRNMAMSWLQKLQCAIDVAEALRYLHQLGILHRDLKARNVLMDSHKPSKLSDFGISRKLVSTTMSQQVGTLMWAAPEVLKGGRLTVAADVYSFGMLLFELDTHQIPFDGLTSQFGDVLVPMAIVMKVMEGDLHVQPSPTCPLPIALIMKACTQFDPTLRPSAADLVRTLLILRV